MQLTHQSSKFNKKKFPITLVCDSVRNARNIGSLFRISDAFGIEKILFCGIENPLSKGMKKTSRSTENHVKYEVYKTMDLAIDQLKSHFLIALEITDDSAPLSSLQIKSQKPMALIIGNENYGVSEETLNKCDTVVHIEMYGNNSSMNVVRATSIALYELTKQLQY